METAKASGGVRDDCWTDGATAVLIEAWGERHLRCNRGNLRQNEWKEVADAVNVGRDSAAGKPRRTDVQCKNRIDTLKKKYKVEKAKSSPSNWPFFNRLDFLIGPSTPSMKNPNPNPKSRFNFAESSESSLDDDELFGVVGRGKKHKLEYGGGSLAEHEEKAAFRELAKAVANFGEVYERIESSKQQLVMELVRQRMEFTKEQEFQRMNMLIDAQLELEKSKRSKNTATSTGDEFEPLSFMLRLYM